MIYQIYDRVTAIYDGWTTDRSERVNESYIAGMSEYFWYVIVIHSTFYISNVTLK